MKYVQKNWRYFVGILFILIIFLHYRKIETKQFIPYSRFMPKYSIDNYPPKILVYSSLTAEYIIANAQMLRSDNLWDGFILASTAAKGWPGNLPKLQEQSKKIKKALVIARKNGLTDNFLNISMAQGAVARWDDEAQWQKDLVVLTAVCRLAKDMGFKGIALDTEPYHKVLWHNGHPRNNLPHIRTLIKKRGSQTTRAILRGFPQAEIVVLPAGHLYAYTKKQPNKYAYWIDFFNGMLTVKPAQGIHLFVERTYKVHSQIKLRDYYYDIEGEIIADNIDDPSYWINRCSIAFGLWPLGREYNDKRANMSAEQFHEQYHTALQYCPKYVWIYAHGLSWWQIADGQRYCLNQLEAALPTVKNITEYKNIIKISKEPDLKFFYKELKFNKQYSYLEKFLAKII